MEKWLYVFLYNGSFKSYSAFTPTPATYLYFCRLQFPLHPPNNPPNWGDLACLAPCEKTGDE